MSDKVVRYFLLNGRMVPVDPAAKKEVQRLNKQMEATMKNIKKGKRNERISDHLTTR